jgi:hypothetical protein
MMAGVTLPERRATTSTATAPRVTWPIAPLLYAVEQIADPAGDLTHNP